MSLSHPTRRALFQQLIGGGCALAVSRNCVGASTFEYQGRPDCIEVFRREGERRWKIQVVDSANPSFLALDRARDRLFAVNEIDEFQGLPRGSVESYALSPGSGLVQLISRQPLSLSATRPKHFAISPDGGFIVVAVYGGGAYNVLPINAGGDIEPVTQVLKEIGRGRDPQMQATAHPHSVVFHPSGKFVIATDFGCDRVNVFRFGDGSLKRIQQIAAPAGSGPAEIHLDRNGLNASVVHRLQSFRCSYQLDESLLALL